MSVGRPWADVKLGSISGPSTTFFSSTWKLLPPMTGMGDGFLALLGFGLTTLPPSGPVVGRSIGVYGFFVWPTMGCRGGLLNGGLPLMERSVVTLVTVPGLRPSSGLPKNGRGGRGRDVGGGSRLSFTSGSGRREGGGGGGRRVGRRLGYGVPLVGLFLKSGGAFEGRRWPWFPLDC